MLFFSAVYLQRNFIRFSSVVLKTILWPWVKNSKHFQTTLRASLKAFWTKISLLIMKRNPNRRVYQLNCAYLGVPGMENRQAPFESVYGNPKETPCSFQPTETLRKRDGNILNASANGNAAETLNIVTILLLHVSRRNRSAET